MWPLILLFVFLGLAVVAIGSFAYLTMNDGDATARREDWKKFLSSFAGTSLALSIGFVSFMLQQQSQNALRRAQETDQIKARLVYSLVQNRVIVESRYNLLNIGGTVETVCHSNAEKQAKDAAFMKFKNDMQKNSPAMKETIARLNATGEFKQDAILKLLVETNVASRIAPQLAQAMSQKEVFLAARAPAVYAAILDVGNVASTEEFCAQSRAGQLRVEAVLVDERMLQAYTCAAYVAVGAGDDGSMLLSAELAKAIAALENDPEPGPQVDANAESSRVATKLAPAVLLGQGYGVIVATGLLRCLVDIAGTRLEGIHKVPQPDQVNPM